MRFFTKSICEKERSSSIASSQIIPATDFSIMEKQWAFHVPAEMDKMSDFDKMVLLRNQKRQNQEKVRKFFGSELKIDISLNTIEKYKLPAMMESDLPLAYFICFLIKYQGIENLFFCLEVEKYKETKYESFENQRMSAQRIFNTFMENGIAMQINTKKEIIEAVREALMDSTEEKDSLLKLFCPAYMDIYSMLVNVYADFEKNEIHKQMLADLSAAGESHDAFAMESSNSSARSIYPQKAYYTALDLISASIGSMEKIYDDQIASKRISINRHRQTKRLIVSFCEKRLKLDFPESSLDLRQSLLTDISESIQTANNRASLISNLSVLSNASQSNSNSSNSLGRKRKDELDLF